MSGPGAGRGSLGELDFGKGRALSRFLRFPAPRLSPFPGSPLLPACGFEAAGVFDCFVTSLTP